MSLGLGLSWFFYRILEAIRRSFLLVAEASIPQTARKGFVELTSVKDRNIIVIFHWSDISETNCPAKS